MGESRVTDLEPGAENELLSWGGQEFPGRAVVWPFSPQKRACGGSHGAGESEPQALSPGSATYCELSLHHSEPQFPSCKMGEGWMIRCGESEMRHRALHVDDH